MKRRVLIPIVLAAVAALPAATAGAGKISTVEVGNGFYGPATKTVKQGDKIRFEWIPSLDLHNVHVKSGPEKFKSPTQAAGKWTRKFGKPGKFVLSARSTRT